MRRTISTPLAAGAAAILLALAVHTATASPLSLSSRAIRATWSSLSLRAEATEAVRCPVTLEGSFHSSTLNNVWGALIGYVSRATIASAACTGGTATAMTEALPWHVRYDSFSGTLPNITGQAVRLVRLGVRGTVAGLTCPYQSTEASPARAILNRGAEGTITGIRADEAWRIPLAPGASFFCTADGPGTLTGTGSVRALGSTASVRLTPIPPFPTAVVSVGDSYIGGEGGRWAGNSLGQGAPELARIEVEPRIYLDEGGTTERIPGCHRSRSAAINFHLPEAINLACSGARTFTSDAGPYRPGLDFRSAGGRVGQLELLTQTVASQPFGSIRMIVISIGGNDFEFGPIVERCVLRFPTAENCEADPFVRERLTPARITENTTAIKEAILRVHRVMADAHYPDEAYRLVVDDYPLPVPPAVRYTEATREAGGCPIRDADLLWATGWLVPTVNTAVWNAVAATGLRNVVRLDLVSALVGRRLCETGVGSIEERGLANWRVLPQALDGTEWVSRIWRQIFPPAPMMEQEYVHPNYWGQLALQSCLRLVYNNGSPVGGTCRIAGTGLNGFGTPNMRLDP